MTTTRDEIERLMDSIFDSPTKAALLSAIDRVLAERDDWKRTCEGEIKLSCERLRGMVQRDDRIAVLEKALQNLLSDGQFGEHSGHFDWTGQHGVGCTVCIAQSQAVNAARAALATEKPHDAAAPQPELGGA